MKPVLAALVVLPLLTSCSSDQAPSATRERGDTSLNRTDLAKATAVAHDVIAEQGASVSSASVIARSGKVTHSNTGHPCTSGRQFRIKLIGTFPHTVTTGHPVRPGSPTPDFTVRAVVITADAESGQACLVGVQTAENGEVKPLRGSTLLPLR